MNHFYLNPKVKSNLGMNFYEMKLRRKKIKLITKWILILNSINSSMGFSQSNLGYRWDCRILGCSRLTQTLKLKIASEIWFLFLKYIPKTIKWMTLITSLRFGFLTLFTPYSFVLRQITIEKTMITNDQELPRITSIG